MRTTPRITRRVEVWMRLKDPSKLARARRRAGFTQVELSRLVGCTQQYISLLESGTAKSPSEKVAVKLCKYLGVDREDYFDTIEVPSMPVVTTVSRVVSRAAS